jgi:hypothetical protein
LFACLYAGTGANWQRSNVVAQNILPIILAMAATHYKISKPQQMLRLASNQSNQIVQ